jgi:Uma2 family endonuclease
MIVRDVDDVFSLVVPASAHTLEGFRTWARRPIFPAFTHVSLLGGEVHVPMGDEEICVPPDAHTLAGFRAWASSDFYPERGRVSLIHGEVWIEMSPERYQSHNKVKTKVTSVLDALVSQLRLGDLYGDGGLITNDAAGLSTEPDSLFVSYETLKSGRAEFVPRGDADDGIELRGSPDWVLEVVSPFSEQKDRDLMPELYFRAGIPEYWIIDARDERLDFTVLIADADGYRAVEPQDGWLASHVFGKQFRLVREPNEVGGWIYDLQTRDVS